MNLVIQGKSLQVDELSKAYEWFTLCLPLFIVAECRPQPHMLIRHKTSVTNIWSCNAVNVRTSFLPCISRRFILNYIRAHLWKLFRAMSDIVCQISERISWASTWQALEAFCAMLYLEIPFCLIYCISSIGQVQVIMISCVCTHSTFFTRLWPFNTHVPRHS